MYYPQTPLGVYLFLFFFAAVLSIVWVSIGVVIRKALLRGKPLVLLLPEVPGLKGKFIRPKLSKGTFRLKSEKDGEWERNVLQDGTAIPTNLGTLWVVAQKTGWNLIAPDSKDKPKLYDPNARAAGDEAGEPDDSIHRRMLVANPLALEEAIENDDFTEFVNSKQEKDPWQVRIAGLVIVALLFALVAAGGVVFLITKAQQAGAA